MQRSIIMNEDKWKIDTTVVAKINLDIVPDRKN